MDSFFLLYGLSFLSIGGAYGPALTTAREAAFVQSGVKADYEHAKAGALKYVAPVTAPAAVVYSLGIKREVRFKSKHVGDWEIRKDRVHVALHWEW